LSAIIDLQIQSVARTVRLIRQLPDGIAREKFVAEQRDGPWRVFIAPDDRRVEARCGNSLPLRPGNRRRRYRAEAHANEKKNDQLEICFFYLRLTFDYALREASLRMLVSRKPGVKIRSVGFPNVIAVRPNAFTVRPVQSRFPGGNCPFQNVLVRWPRDN
jgi:hypothetical protein